MVVMKTKKIRKIQRDRIVDQEKMLSGYSLEVHQENSNISVSELARMTGLSRTLIYRAFNDVSYKSHKILIYMALTYPELFYC